MLKVFQIFFIPFSHREGTYQSYFYCSTPKDEAMYLYEHRTRRNTLAHYVQSSTIVDLMSYDLFHNCF